MSIDISQLEQAWLEAETLADEAKHEALRLSRELAMQRETRGEGGHDVNTLVTTIEQLKARQEEAERTASAAFDRFWSAQGSRNDGGGQAYA
jgi:hypothetical protein